MAPDQPDPATVSLDQRPALPGSVRRFRLTVQKGPQPGLTWESTGDSCTIGFHPLNDLILDDPTVSRFHCEVKIEAARARVRDLDSRNGTTVDGVALMDGFLREGSLLEIGQVTLRFELVGASNQLPLCARPGFGGLVGTSVAARASFALMERASQTNVTVLLEGETGTGKTSAAEAIHGASARADAPLVVLDCSAIPANLLESELFGHEKGAFTGASTQRIGAFEEADGGTIFLDEIGELPTELQPKLLRVVENRQIRRVGSNGYRPIDVRVIAATNRDLRKEVNEGRFRSDLYYRFAVVRIPLPPLRQRLEDLPLLVEQILAASDAQGPWAAPLREPAFVRQLEQFAWPGNVRELRNYIERCLFFRDTRPPELGGEPVAAVAEVAGVAKVAKVDSSVPYAEARRHTLDGFERAYLKGLMKSHAKMMDAARAAGMGRINLYKLLRKHGLK